ncbi:TonB-dependent receptor domain-containing protein [Hymenobacter antarcticus]|uniref:TonB-dependent receptor domain-containing protein n=1 Tax=Hymenobacter antarcticus TaxID=486270 RepID=UPI0031E594B9
MILLLLLLTGWLGPVAAVAQAGSGAGTPPAVRAACASVLTVRVTDHETGQPLPGATVRLLETGEALAADAAGNCRFQACPGTCQVEVRLVGYRAETGRVQLRAGQPGRLELALRATAQELTAVQVEGQSEATTLQRSAQAVAVLDLRPYYGQAFGLTELVNRVPGVRIRQDGGLGSNANLSLNGLGGKQVRVFLDGIPLEFYGRGLGLNVLPVSLLERVEVYRGVTPVSLGADALGGALNVITRREQFSYLDASYELSAFNTHKAALNGRYVLPASGFYVAGNGFYNRADNDYQVQAEVISPVGTPEKQTVRRFHDQFSSYLGRAEIGWQDRPWADKLALTVFGAGVDKQLQHNVQMLQAYGAARYAETSAGAALSYQKTALRPGLDVRAYAGYTRVAGALTDTSRNIYNWDGRITERRRVSSGEIVGIGSLLALTSHTGVARLNATQALGAGRRLVANVLGSSFRRAGDDAIIAARQERDYARDATTLRKLVAGLAYEHDWAGGRWGSSTAVKYFGYQSDGFGKQDSGLYLETRQARQWLGANQLLRWQPAPAWVLKGSYEYAARLPDEYELFGDGVLVRANPALKAETSHNANLEVRYARPTWSAEVGGFLRAADNVIYQPPSIRDTQNQNLLKARTLGAEAAVRYAPVPALSLTLNATYQDVRSRTPLGQSGAADARYFNARMPNLPYFFGNAEVQLSRANVGGADRRLSAWYQASYVQAFYLYWATDGFAATKATIPSQLVQHLGLSYALAGERLTLSAEVHNLADAPAYDNFNVQRPGRSGHLKLRAFLRKNS